MFEKQPPTTRKSTDAIPDKDLKAIAGGFKKSELPVRLGKPAGDEPPPKKDTTPLPIPGVPVK